MAKSFEQLKSEVESTQRELDRLQGSADSLLDKLRDDYKITKVSDAKKLLIKLERKREALHKKTDKSTQEFQDEWAEQLD